MLLRAEQTCAYDLDDVDQRWLINLNGERALMGLSSVNENEMERIMEELERQCRDKINTSLRSSEDTEIQQDESIICDVCRSVSCPSFIQPFFEYLFLLIAFRKEIMNHFFR